MATTQKVDIVERSNYYFWNPHKISYKIGANLGQIDQKLKFSFFKILFFSMTTGGSYRNGDVKRNDACGMTHPWSNNFIYLIKRAQPYQHTHVIPISMLQTIVMQQRKPGSRK